MPKFTQQQAALISAIDLFVATTHKAAATSGWWIDTDTGEDVRTWPKKFFKLWVSAKLMLIVAEIGEAMEGWRKDLMDDKLPHRKMFTVELADAMILIGDLIGGLAEWENYDADLGAAAVEKMEFNSQRADHKIENRVAEGGKSI